MTNIKKNKTSLFLMELIVVILFLSIACAVCVKIFVEGKKISDESRDITYAVIAAQNAAQILKSSRGDIESLMEYYNASGSSIYFDDDFESCSKKDAKYTMIVEQSYSDSIVTSDISIINNSEGGRTIFKLKSDIFKN